jgi:hypothetical protein
LFSGGFLGLDNIGAFDRSQVLPNGATLRQADGTAWMAFYRITMLEMALELASGEGQRIHQAYEDMASKFLEHFVQIADAMNRLGGSGLWHDEDGFYYDQPPVPPGYSLAPPSGARPELHARRERVPLALRNSVPIQILQEGLVYL